MLDTREECVLSIFERLNIDNFPKVTQLLNSHVEICFQECGLQRDQNTLMNGMSVVSRSNRSQYWTDLIKSSGLALAPSQVRLD